MTTWHITFGTYGDRLHGGERLTVDRCHNIPGTSFLPVHPAREQVARASLRFDPVILSDAQQLFIESTLSDICTRGNWQLVTGAAGPNHVHTLLEVDHAIHGKQVRPFLKRWLTQALNDSFPSERRVWPMTWWSECGSTRAVTDPDYRLNAINYINRQRATTKHAHREPERPRSEADGPY